MGMEKLGRPKLLWLKKVKMGQKKVKQRKKKKNKTGDQGEEAIQPFEHTCDRKKSDIIRTQYFQQQ